MLITAPHYRGNFEGPRETEEILILSLLTYQVYYPMTRVLTKECCPFVEVINSNHFKYECIFKSKTNQELWVVFFYKSCRMNVND